MSFTTNKFCVNCIHFRYPRPTTGDNPVNVEEGTCTHPSAIIRISVINGTKSYRKALEMRFYQDSNFCSYEARFYQEK